MIRYLFHQLWRKNNFQGLNATKTNLHSWSPGHFGNAVVAVERSLRRHLDQWYLTCLRPKLYDRVLDELPNPSNDLRHR
jgi:hypothetical protein